MTTTLRPNDALQARETRAPERRRLGLKDMAGGAPVLFSMLPAVHDDTIGLGYYTIPLQYTATGFLCWGVLMFIRPAHRHEP